MSNLSKWGEWTDDALKQDTASASSNTKNYMKLVEGDNIVRILPPKPGKQHPLMVTQNHFLDMPDGRKVSFNCPRMMAKRACPVCAKGEQLRLSKSFTDQKLGKRMFPRVRVFANVIDRNNPDLGVQILTFGKGILDDLMSIRANPRKGGNFTHPETGRDIVITRKGTGQFDTEYSVTPDVATSPLHDDPGQQDDWLDMAYDLDFFGAVLSDEEIKAKLRGDGPEQEERPATKTISVKPRGRTVEDDADSFDTDSF